VALPKIICENLINLPAKSGLIAVNQGLEPKMHSIFLTALNNYKIYVCKKR
jgi:hypothetical protein